MRILDHYHKYTNISSISHVLKKRERKKGIKQASLILATGEPGKGYICRFLHLQNLSTPYHPMQNNLSQSHHLHYSNSNVAGSTVCSPQDRPRNQETTCWGKEYFIWKADWPRKWQTNALRNHLPRVRIQASFILKEEGEKSNTSGFRSSTQLQWLIWAQLFPSGLHVTRTRHF